MKPDVFELCFFLSEFFISFVEFIIQECVLFEDELVFQLEIFGSSESYSCSIEIFLNSVAVIFESVHFPLIEIQVIFSGRFTIDSGDYLLF